MQRARRERAGVASREGTVYNCSLMKPIGFVLVALTLGCSASGGGDPVGFSDTGARADASSETPSDTSIEDTTDPTGDAIFPLDDTAVTETAADTTTDDTSTCGAVGKPCCGTTCSVGYCYMGTCLAKPTVVEEGGESSVPELCADLGVTHAPPAFLTRYTVTGRPGATVHRWAKKVSCVGAKAFITAESPLTITAAGTVSFKIENLASTVCTDANIGRYEVWVVVDGAESDHHFGTFYNSSCGQTCKSAAGICPG